AHPEGNVHQHRHLKDRQVRLRLVYRLNSIHVTPCVAHGETEAIKSRIGCAGANHSPMTLCFMSCLSLLWDSVVRCLLLPKHSLPVILVLLLWAAIIEEWMFHLR